MAVPEAVLVQAVSCVGTVLPPGAAGAQAPSVSLVRTEDVRVQWSEAAVESKQ